MRAPSIVMACAALACTAFACTAPDKLQNGTCGNGVVDPGEDCEYYPGETVPCGQPGTPNQCHFICDHTQDTLQCMVGFACQPNDECVASPGVCGNGVIDSGEDCDLGMSPDGMCGAPDTPGACHYLCDHTKPGQQCPTGSACEPDDVCINSPGVCGNGVVDPGEDCDFGTSSVGSCGAPGSAAGCHFVCSASILCPPAASCGVDGLCHDAGGLVEATASQFTSPAGAFSVMDFDGDHKLDLVWTSPLTIAFGIGDGTFPSTSVLPVSAFESAIGDFNGDGRKDLAFEGGNGGFQYDLSTPSRGFEQVPFPAEDVTLTGDGSSGSPDLWIAMRPNATSPFEEMLHLEFEGTQLRLGFDEFGADQTPQTVQASAIPGGQLVAWPQMSAPAYPVANAINAAATGGDELALGLQGDTVIRMFTARATPTLTLVADASIALPGPLTQPPLFADINGDGKLDVVATVTGSTSQEVVVALGTGTAFGTATVNAGLTDAFCFPTAATNLKANTPAEVFCNGAVFAIQANGTVIQTSPSGVSPFESVFVDLNRDGVPDLVGSTGTPGNGLQIEFGNANGAFSTLFIPTEAFVENLRVGDFDGDQIQDVSYVQFTSEGEQLFILYGSTGALGSPVLIDTLQSASSVEPMLLGADQSGVAADATSDLITDTIDQVTFVPELSVLSGDSNRTMDDPFGFDLFFGSVEEIPPAILAGRYSGSAQADEMLEPIQDVANGIGTLVVDDLPFDAHHRPTNSFPNVTVQVSVSAFTDGTFNMTSCGALFATGDTAGSDGIDELVVVQALAVGSDGFCDPLSPPLLLSLSLTTGSNGDTNDPVALAGSGIAATAIKLADLDGDGNLDLLVAFQGDPTICDGSNAPFPCTNTGNEFLVVWGSATGLTTQTTEVPAIPSSGTQQDAVALRIDALPTPELLVTTSTGLFAYDLQADRSYVARTTPILDYTNGSTTISGFFGTTLATGDINGDGLTDLLVDDDGTLHVLLMVPAASTAP